MNQEKLSKQKTFQNGVKENESSYYDDEYDGETWTVILL